MNTRPGSFEQKKETTARADHQEKGPFQAPSITLPKGGGAIRGIGEKFAANPVTGTGSMTVPIATSPDRSGFGPQLSLSYDSGSGNGPFGFGWSLSLPSISRKTDKGLPQYRDAEESDVFILSGAEDLVPAFKPNTTEVDEFERNGYRVRRYRPRIEGLFARIERWTNLADPGDIFWRSISRDNITTFYGKSAESRIADPADPTRIFSWLICQSFVDKGSAIVYEYQEENSDGIDLSQAHEKNRTTEGRKANRYLKRVKYGNRTPNRDVTTWKAIDPAQLPGDTWMFEVVFDYEEGHYEALPPDDQGRQFVRAAVSETQHRPMRQDPFSSYRAGFEVRTYRLCQRVLMFHHFPDELGTPDYLVRSMELTYNPGPIASFITEITQSGYVRRPDGTYLKKSLPPLSFEYSEAVIHDEIETIDPESLQNLPVGADSLQYQWLDLDGEGLQGVLSEQQEGWYYKRNRSPISVVKDNGKEKIVARFEPLTEVATQPSIAKGAGARHQFLDLAGDGNLDVVRFERPLSGFFERTGDEKWESFIPFRSVPNVQWNDPNLRFIDLTGDGHADILITEDDALTWYPSLAEEGFGTAIRVPRPRDEEKGPAVVFADVTQSIYAADLSGDGLSDIVRIRNGEVCYWPNLGYGRFGSKVIMDDAPWFESQDQFDPGRIRLGDIDGSGTTDIIYLERDRVAIYRNECGNRWSPAEYLASFPAVDNLASVTAVDLLGNGTACLVWSSPLPGNARRPMRYIDLMGGQKPHLLTRAVNNLGAETLFHYTPSTKFYLADKLAGKPWITRLPFPVHVVERVETRDLISRNRFVTRYAYHHGYYDGIEREFRGFGMVEQFDTEEIAALTESGDFPEAVNIDAASYVPTVLTKTWFHTGVFAGLDHVSDFFAGLLDADDVGEYYREPGMTDAQARALLLPDTVLPPGLTPEEEREACRALKGSMLRQEVYALDGTGRENHPYIVTEQNFAIRRPQPKAGNRHAVFFTHANEAISYHYDRNPADPRIGHALTLEVDESGNVLKSAAIGYGRRRPDPELEPRDQAKQGQLLITYTESDVTNSIEADDDYRTPLPCETRTYEVTGLTLPTGQNRFTFGDVLNGGSNAAPLAYEQNPTAGVRQKRLIEEVRTLYRRNDLSGPLPVGRLESLAMPFESYKLAFTPGLLAQVFHRNGQPLLSNPAAVLGGQGADRGGYVDLDGNGHWWIPSGRVFLSLNSNDTSDQELAYARQHFFLPSRYRDPFHTSATSTESFVLYDTHDLLVLEIRDALENAVRAVSDYRVLAPKLMKDANGNRSEVAFDVLGMVVGTAVMGKVTETSGDHLDPSIEPDLTRAQLDAFMAKPREASAYANESVATQIVHDLLGTATMRILYDLDRFKRHGKPPFAATVARETHVSDLQPGQRSRIQISFSYSDGLGREIQKKIQAEPGPMVEGGPVVNPRWVGNGWTIFNNKGKQVRQYEPFFDDTHDFKFGLAAGVSPVLFYDPVERVVATLHPNHTYEKVVFDRWQQATWDVNDTVTFDPKTDGDVKEFFTRLPDAEYLPTWYGQRSGGQLGPKEHDAAVKAAVHAGTPTIAHLDSLGRPFLTIAQNRFERNHVMLEEKYSTRVELDIEGNQREVIDAKDRIVMRYDYDMLGTRIHQASMEAGESWMLNDQAGKQIRAWDSRGHQFKTEYDQLRRPLRQFVRGTDMTRSDPRALNVDVLFARVEYGEGQANDNALNLRTRVFKSYDGAGVVTSEAYDFKGNLLRTSQALADNYKKLNDWTIDSVQPSWDTFTSHTTYDALNRSTAIITPDGSVYRPTFNEADLLEKVDVNVRGAQAATSFVTNIEYNAKGQRLLIEYGNNVKTEYAYDPLTFGLMNLKTTRLADQARLQDLNYTYDPADNITQIQDDAHQPIYFNNQVVMPGSAYTYDAIYRLINAEGREHIGQAGRPQATWDDRFRTHLPHPVDGQAMRRYTEQYDYDEVGNFLHLIHQATNGSWTRMYAYNEPGLIEPGRKSNRLSRTNVGVNNPELHAYDAHGNMIAMPHLTLMQWDYRDQLRATSRQVVTDGPRGTTYYVYDTSGQRVRKVTERQNGTRKNERIYLDGFEIYREYDGNGNNVILERETLHVMDDQQRIALVETKTRSDQSPIPDPQPLIRYQLGNHLGSSSLELDDAGQIISYEEYYPYGSTSYQAGRSAAEVSLKRYRYTARERDEETGFAYHGARYYAPWLGRWLSCDPVGHKSSAQIPVNLYSSFALNPIVLVDLTGESPEKPPIPGPVKRFLRKLGQTIVVLIAITHRNPKTGVPEPIQPRLKIQDPVERDLEMEKDRDAKQKPKKTASPPPNPPSEPGHITEKKMGGEPESRMRRESGGGGGRSGGGGRAGGGGSAGGGVGKAGRGAARLASFFVAIPDPTDVFFMGLAHAASLAEALEEQKAEKYALGFAEGLAAQLLGLPPEFVTRRLMHQVARYGDDIAGFSVPKENASIKGAKAGYIFGSHLTPEEATALLKKGRMVLAAKNQAISLSHPTRDDVIDLGIALLPTVNQIFEKAREEARKQEELERRRMKAESGCIGMKC